MSSQNILPKGVICSPKDVLSVDPEFASLVKETLKEHGVFGKSFSLHKKNENQIYTAFWVKIDEAEYDLKITFDCENTLFNDEISCLKNNKYKTTPTYVCSGFLDIKTKIKFLLSRSDIGISLRENGYKSIFKNLDHFFSCLFVLNNYEARKKPNEYLDLFFCNHDLDHEFLVSNSDLIDNGHHNVEYKAILDFIENDLFMNGNIEALEGSVFCHGMIDNEAVFFCKDIVKFKNLGYSFLGNPLIDLAFVCVSLCLSSERSTILLKKYCDLLSLDFMSHKQSFDDCIYIASCIYFYRNIFLAYIAKLVTKDPSSLSMCVYNLNYSLRYFKRLKSFKQIKSSESFSLLLSGIKGH